MIERIQRLVGVASMFVVGASICTGMIPGPQDEPMAADHVKEFVTAARDVARFGAAAAPVLNARAAIESPSTAALVTYLGEALAGKAAAEGTDTAPASVEPAVKRFALATHKMLALKDRVLASVQAAVADPANADVRHVVEKAEQRVLVSICLAAIRDHLKPDNTIPGTYEGMFAHLEKHGRDKIADAFLDAFQSSRQSPTVRDLAGEGLAQLGGARHQAAVKAILTNAKENDRVRQRALYTLARLGDRGPVDKILADYAAKMETLKKPEMSPAETVSWAEGYYRSALIAQSIHDTDAAIKFYESFLVAIEPVREKLAGRIKLDGCHYNLACLYSLKNEIDAAIGALEKAFAAGYNDFQWAGKDGDLANVRKDPRFRPLVEKFEAPKKEAPPVESRPS
jgi:tetratricopeptide (TPR) repeat protein